MENAPRRQPEALNATLEPCPYRKEHEWDDEGKYCRHCYAKAPDSPEVITQPMDIFGWAPNFGNNSNSMSEYWFQQQHGGKK